MKEERSKGVSCDDPPSLYVSRRSSRLDLFEKGKNKKLIIIENSIIMGGGDHGNVEGDFRNKVWSMTGGPYCRPKHWKRNTAIAMASIFLICIPIAIKSAELEQRPHHPVRPIPSQLWCKNFGKKEY